MPFAMISQHIYFKNISKITHLFRIRDIYLELAIVRVIVPKKVS